MALPEGNIKLQIGMGGFIGSSGLSMTTFRSRAPLRLGLAGGGSDLSPFCDQFGGAVLNATIERYALASVRARTDGRTVFEATDLAARDEVDLTTKLPTDRGLRLHRGVYNRMMRDFNGGALLPITLTTFVESPLGSGLGSSSALVVAMVEVLRTLIAAPLGQYEIAQLAFEIEREDLELNGGRQDHYAATFGGFNFMEFGPGDRVIVNPLRIAAPVIAELESSLVLLFTGASRESSRIIDAQSAAVAQGGRSLEAMHQLKMEAVAMKEAILFGRTQEMADVLQRGWAAKKATSSAVSNPEIDRTYDLAMGSGALAGKISGAGGGGVLMFLVDPIRRAELITRLETETAGRCVAARFTSEGVMSWRV